jgi:NADH dehydrogenase FAD-containing subunit
MGCNYLFYDSIDSSQAITLLKEINPHDWHVVVVSPQNYFLFTPLLPSATVGTLEPRSSFFQSH